MIAGAIKACVGVVLVHVVAPSCGCYLFGPEGAKSPFLQAKPPTIIA